MEGLSRIMGENIKIKRSGDGTGKIIIGFSNDQEIVAMVEKLEKLGK